MKTIRGGNGKRGSCKAHGGIHFYLPLKILSASEATGEVICFSSILVIMLLQCAVWKEHSQEVKPSELLGRECVNVLSSRAEEVESGKCYFSSPGGLLMAVRHLHNH